MKNWLIKKLGGFTEAELVNHRAQAESAGSKSGYTNGFRAGIASVNNKKIGNTNNYTPGWLRKEVHRKLDLMFNHDNFGDRARYRWLQQNSMTTSHMSQMSYNELIHINKLLAKTTGEPEFPERNTQ